MKILAQHLNTYIQYAQLRGIPPEELLQAVSASIDVDQATATVTAADFYAVLSGMVQQLQDEKVGLRVGEFMNLNALGLVYQISLQATTIEEGLLYLKSFLHATFPLIQIDIAVKATDVTVTLHIEQEEAALNRIILESTLTVIHRELTMMAGEPLSLSLFSPFYDTDYPVCWKKATTFYLSFKPFLLKAAIKDKSRLHLDLLIPQYLQLIESIDGGKSFNSQVKIAALQMSKPDLPDLAQVASVFNLTPRTLQRRLKEEKSSFRQLTDELKKQLSYLLIHHNRFSVADVSYVLGYAEPAAFIHSFRKWFGNSPQQFRKQIIFSS